MKNGARFFALAVLFLALTGFGDKKNTAVLGSWIGEFTSFDRSVPIRVHFWQDQDGLKGSIHLLDEGPKDHPLSWVMFERSNVHFELVRGSGTLVFDGEISNGKITGDLLVSNLRGRFQLSPEKLVSL